MSEAPDSAPTEKPKASKREPKVAKPKKEAVVARPRLPKYPDDNVITVLKENAKARNANERFKRYQTGMSVRQYLDTIKTDFNRTEGQTFADMRWDENHKFIHIGPSVIEVPAEPEETPAE
jgi:hypothetical protein